MTQPETHDEVQRVSVVRPTLTPLPHTRVGALEGLLELLDDRGGREDLHRLAGDVQFEVNDLQAKHFSAAEARRQLETAILWRRYAELFGFEDDTDELFLEASQSPPA